MKLLLQLLLPIVLLACRTRAPAEATAPEHRAGSDTGVSTPAGPLTARFAGPSTALPVTPLVEIPAGFALETLVRTDATRNYSATLHLPRAVSDEAFNTVIGDFAAQVVEAEQPDPGTADPTTLEMWLIEFRATAEVVQLLFREQTYTGGAAHYNHGFLTLSYDVGSRKRLFFTDLVVFTESRNKRSFCDLVNRHEAGLESDDEYTGSLTPEELDRNADFELRDGKLVLYPNDCCADEGRTYGIALDLVQSFIDPAVAKKLGVNPTERP